MKSLHIPYICGLGLNFELDGFRIIYAVIISFMWIMTTIFSTEYMKGHKNNIRYYFFTIATFVSTLGVFLGGDLYTIFIFFEIMSFTSFVWVAQEETKEALAAAKTYLAVAIIGGLVMLMGIFILYHELGTVKIDEIYKASIKCKHPSMIFAACVCLLVGFGAKAGAFPLHIWLPKAHPVAPAPASALLSGALTKTGVFGILIITCRILVQNEAWGIMISVIGAITMTLGAFIALFSVDIKRTLACSSMSQIGFIFTGTGMISLLGEHRSVATYGVFLHMINHSIIKLVLFMIAGVIYMNIHVLDLNAIRGFGRKKPFIKYCFLIGALAIGGVPFFAGYISKTLLHEAILEAGQTAWLTIIEYLFLISGGFTLAYMTKLFVAVFVEKNLDEATQAKFDKKSTYMSKRSYFAIGISALVLLYFGFAPHSLMEPIASHGQEFLGGHEELHPINYLSVKNLEGAIVSMAIAVIVYFLVIRSRLTKEVNGKYIYIDRWNRVFDLEEIIYKPMLFTVISGLCGIIARIFDCIVDYLVIGLRRSIYADSPLPRERLEGNIFTDAIGNLLNTLQHLRNRVLRKSSENDKDYVHILAIKNQVHRENSSIIQRSLSFGLMMFGIGFMLTLIYILFH